MSAELAAARGVMKDRQEQVVAGTMTTTSHELHLRQAEVLATIAAADAATRQASALERIADALEGTMIGPYGTLMVSVQS